jgi:hypothetical protein
MLAVAGAVGLGGCSSSSSGGTPVAAGSSAAASPSASPATSPSASSPSASPVPAVTVTSTVTATPSSGVKDLVISAAVRAQLVQTVASSEGLTAADFIGLVAGQTYYAFDPKTSTYWAGAAMDPSPSSQAAEVSVQDDGGYVLFKRAPGQPWLSYDVGLAGIEGATCPVTPPATVLAVWGWKPGTCHPKT